MCDHMNFKATVSVGRINRQENGPIVAYQADIKIECAECQQPFEFFNLPNGMSFYQPTVSIDGRTACMPLVIPGTRPPDGMPGYRVLSSVAQSPDTTIQ